MVATLGVSFVGYHAAYRGIYRAEGGYRLPRGRMLAVVMARFGGFFAHRGRTPDDLALQKAGQVPRIRFPVMINGVPVVAAPAEIDVSNAEQLCTALLGAVEGRRRSRGGHDPHPVL
jgi:hypothetical protein